MDLRAWEGFVLIAIFLGGAYLRVRAERRVGTTHSFGHPALDQLLLFASGLMLAAILGATLFLLKDNPHPIKNRVIAYPLVILLGLLLTYVCNRVLRRSNKR